MECQFLEIIKTIIFNDKNLKYFYTKKFIHSKYNIDNILNDILYVLKMGVSWRNVRSSIKWQSLYWHFKRLSDNNIFKKSFNYFRDKYMKNNNTNIQIIDSTFILNKFGRNKVERNKFFKNKKCNKISLITDAYGIPISVLLDSGNKHDLTFIDKHIKDLYFLNNDNNIILLADKGYVSSKTKNYITHYNYNLMYPSKKNMKQCSQFDKNLYKKRINIEHSFQRIKSFRRIQCRYDFYYKTYLSFINLACSLIIYQKLFNIKN